MNIHHKAYEADTVDPRSIANELDSALTDIQGLTVLTGFLLAEHWEDRSYETIFGLNSVASVMEREVKRSMDLAETLSKFVSQ